jgi:hypothetical protein
MKKLSLITTLAFLYLCPAFAQFNSQMSMMRQQQMYMAQYQHRKDNGQNVGSYQREYAGVCTPLINATFSHKIAYIDPLDNTTVHRMSITRAVKPVSSYGFYGGDFYPIAAMGDNALMAICTEVEMDITQFKPGPVSFYGTDHYDVTFAAIGISVPISVDIKWGGEATLDKSQFSSYTIGFGFAPGIVLTSAAEGDFANYPTNVNNNNNYSKFITHPFFKFEYGIFAGLFIKARVMYSFGKFTYFDYGSGYDQNNGYNISIKGNPNCLTVGLSLTGLSYDWKDVSWWKHPHRHKHHYH